MESETLNKEQKEILIKKESTTNPSLGHYPNKRPLDLHIQYGLVNINKFSGPTSHQIADMVKKVLNIKKAGHSGSLDPKVTGVLPVALAKATRITDVLLKSEKEYVCWMHIHNTVDEEKLRQVIKEFIGIINQLPPRKSAVKRQERQRNVSYIDILEIEEKEVLFKVGCQAGTYIRKLVHDIGIKLNTGAHMAQLIRTKAGPFDYTTWHTLQDVKDAFEEAKEGNEKPLREIIVPYEESTKNMKKIWVHDSAVDTLCHGSSLGVPGIAKVHSNINANDSIAIMTLKDELITTATAQLSSPEMIHNNKGLAATLHKVFMERGTYKE